MMNVLTTKMLAAFFTATATFAAVLPAATAANPVLAAQTPRKQGGNPAKSQANLQVTLENTPNVVAGEPIVLHYVITNTAQTEDEGIAADLGEYYGKLYTMKLVSQNGTVLPLLPKPSRRLPVSPISTEGGILMAGQSREGFVVVTQRFAMTAKGKYTLTFDANIPYMRYNPNGASQMIDYQNLRTTGLAIQGKYSFPLTVREAAPGELANVASQLRRRFLASTDVKQKERIATALFSMSPSEVLAFWKRLAYEASASDRPLIAKALAQTFTKEAADVLVKMEFNHPVQDNNGNAVSVMQTISEMSDASDAELKKYIQSLFAAHRVKVPSYPTAID